MIAACRQVLLLAHLCEERGEAVVPEVVSGQTAASLALKQETLTT